DGYQQDEYRRRRGQDGRGDRRHQVRFFFSSRRRHTRWPRDWSSDVCSSDLVGTAIRRDRSRFPAIVVMPQCRKNVWWAGSTMADVAMAALAEAQSEFNGDRTRIYLTGLSMGGYGSWYLAGKYPGKFAAIAPI